MFRLEVLDEKGTDQNTDQDGGLSPVERLTSTEAD